MSSDGQKAQGLDLWIIFAICSPILGGMFGPEPARVCDFTVRCKGCGENIPAPVGTLPDTWIVAECALCGQRRRYLPSEIFRGRLSRRLRAQRGRGVPGSLRPWW